MLHNSSSWEYYLNIVGSEYPLTTNYQVIQKMESVDNDKGFAEVSFATEGVKDRMKYAYRLPESEQGTGKIQVLLRSLSTKITLYLIQEQAFGVAITIMSLTKQLNSTLLLL